MRICLDPRNLNTAVKQENFQLSTIEEITSRMSGAKVFSKVDANHGYWQLKLDSESELLTTFNTPFSRYCYQRAPFGINSIQEVYRRESVETDINDILVWGRSQEEHDTRSKNTLYRCEQI